MVLKVFQTHRLKIISLQVTSIDVINPPVTLQIVNKTATSVFLSNLNVKGSLVVLKESLGEISTSCFAQQNFIHLLTQYVQEYSENVWTVFCDMLASVNGTPIEVYTAPGATSGGLLILNEETGISVFPVNHIVAIYPGAETVYNPNFTFLTPPDPLPPGCDTDILLAIKNYIPENADVSVRLGPTDAASGLVYKNELGVMVLSDLDGNTPILIPSLQIIRLFYTPENNLQQLSSKNSKKPQIFIEDKN